MSLRDKLRQGPQAAQPDLYATYGVLGNPFPASSQTSGNPHFPIPADDEAEARILAFLRDGRSQVLVVEGTQGVGKTNFLNYFEQEIQQARSELDGYYLVRYLADPEASFDTTIRRIFQEFGTPHLRRMAMELREHPEVLEEARSFDLRQMLESLSRQPENDELLRLSMEWLLGFRLLNSHRYSLNVNFRLDTVESRTAVLRDFVLVSSSLGILKGIFLLLDELEKQDGVLGPTAVVRYLSAMRAIIDALPNHLFMMIAVTPDAMRRYAAALPAFRSRLENQITLSPLTNFDEAKRLADFYVHEARKEAVRTAPAGRQGSKAIVAEGEMSDAFAAARRVSERRGDEGVRQREFLHNLNKQAEEKFQGLVV